MERSSAGLNVGTDGMCGTEPVRRQTTKWEKERPIVLLHIDDSKSH